ncbi:MAG: nucleoside deaminase [Deltaproteobacteria bacterium]|nr:nucleoside deaminase [Deltaproteobacteria bacterium]
MAEANPHYLRYAIMVARRSRQHGNRPFGAILVSDRGRILLEAENTQVAASDCTAHAETNLLREASRRFTRGLLARCTLYVNAEPCPMCAGAVFWSGVGRVVFALSSSRLYALTRDTPDRLLEGCADVLAKGTHRVEVIGPMIEEEAEQVFEKQSGTPNLIAH